MALRQVLERRAEDRANAMTEKDVEFLRSVGIETDLETLRNGARNIAAKK